MNTNNTEDFSAIFCTRDNNFSDSVSNYGVLSDNVKIIRHTFNNEESICHLRGISPEKFKDEKLWKKKYFKIQGIIYYKMFFELLRSMSLFIQGEVYIGMEHPNFNQNSCHINLENKANYHDSSVHNASFTNEQILINPNNSIIVSFEGINDHSGRLDKRLCDIWGIIQSLELSDNGIDLHFNNQSLLIKLSQDLSSPEHKSASTTLNKQASASTTLNEQASASTTLNEQASTSTTHADVEKTVLLLERENKYWKKLLHCSQPNCDEKIASISLPCGHVSMCAACANAYTHCPSCKKKIKATANIYLS